MLSVPVDLMGGGGFREDWSGCLFTLDGLVDSPSGIDWKVIGAGVERTLVVSWG